MDPVSHLKNKVLAKKSTITALTELVYMAKEFGCVSDLFGRDLEVTDPEGKLVYRIRQKPMKFRDFMVLVSEYANIKKEEAKQAKNKGKKGRR